MTTNGINRLRARVGKEKLLMHAFLGYKGYDHIDRNELNNRKYNLRPCTHQQNCCNRKSKRVSASGVIGVYLNKPNGKWIAKISINGINTHLGIFTNKEDAIKARLMAEQIYYGEFAPQKDLREQYNIGRGD